MSDRRARELCATVIALTPMHRATFEANQGRAVHALFLRLVGQADPGLSERLHDEAQVKPFTCSNVWRTRPASSPPRAGRDEAGRRSMLTEAALGEEWQVRFTTLSGDLTRLWMERVLPALPSEVTLSEATYRVIGTTCSAEENSWAGAASYADLAAPYLLGSAPPPTRWPFSFVPPTAFHSGGMTVPLPLPDLLFGSLLDRWNAWSPVALNPEIRRYAQECIAISRYTLRSRALRFRENSVQRGAVGRCEYVALNRDRYWCSATSVLAAYAFYSGAGYQTTQGMGTCRWTER